MKTIKYFFINLKVRFICWRIKYYLSPEKYNELILHLSELGTYQANPVNCSYGLCAEILKKYYNRYGLKLIFSLFKYWPQHSGDIDYPVKSPVRRLSPAKFSAQCMRLNENNLWLVSDRVFQQGDEHLINQLDDYVKSRRALCRFLSNVLKEKKIPYYHQTW